MDLGTAIGKPFSNIKNLVILIVLQIIPLINIITVPGYMIRVANRTMNNDNSMPDFGNFGELIVDSIKYIVISIVYMIPAMVVFIIAIGPLVTTAINAALIAGTPAEVQLLVNDMVMEGLTTMMGLLSLGAILAILGMILILSGMMNYAKTKQFGKAFAVVENLKNFFTVNFIVAVIVSIVLGIVSGIVMGLVTLIPIIGFIIAIIVTVAVSVMQISVLAEGYSHGIPVQGPQVEQAPQAKQVP